MQFVITAKLFKKSFSGVFFCFRVKGDNFRKEHFFYLAFIDCLALLKAQICLESAHRFLVFIKYSNMLTARTASDSCLLV